ncbi:MAG TPA: DNA-3-methyladenine glycosylase 2 family protein [Bacillota bacterium]|nr:DNA-3-methyladenine glycosylase 2 family protein [Bacillota bacterium]
MDTLTINKLDENVQQLAQSDTVMGRLIDYVGNIEIPLRTDYLASLIRSITGQQISVAAASAVFERLNKLTGNTQSGITAVSDEALHNIGLSKRKIQYIRDLLNHIERKDLDLTKLPELDNDTIIKQLTSVKGIGKWTAEMFLILSLGRMDVLAIDDIGIQRGARWLYQVDKSERRDILKKKEPVWSPHLTIASCYLWEVVHLDLERRFPNIDNVD